MAGEPSDTAGRTAAYAELVAAVLDLRSATPTHEFDASVLRAVAEGRLSEDLARELKWLQRQSLRELVAHAQQVLPATLVALESASSDVRPPLDDSTVSVAPAPEPTQETPTDPAVRPWPTPGSSPAEAAEPAEPAEPAEATAPPEPTEPTREPDPSPPVDLTARRLLVAGLRPIEDPPFP